MGLSVKGLLEARKGTRIWILVKGSRRQEFFRPSPTYPQSQKSCLHNDAAWAGMQPAPEHKKGCEGAERTCPLFWGKHLLCCFICQSLQPQCHTHLEIAKPWKSMWWPQLKDQKASTHFPATDGQGNAAPWQTVPWGRWSFTANSLPAWFVFWSLHCRSQESQGRAEVWLSREQRRGLDVSQSSRRLFRRETKQQDEREVPGMAECERWVWVQEAGAVHQPGAGLPGSGNSAPTVIYNPTVSVS